MLAADTAAPAQPHVLVVDDDGAFRLLLRKTLETAGYRVSEAKNALEVFRAECPDLVILDVQMPGISGFKVLDSFKSDPCFKGKIVVMTAQTGPQYPQQARDGGADAFMLKPMKRENFLSQVESLLKQDAEENNRSGRGQPACP